MNHEREEGLDQIYDSLIGGSDQFYRDANSEIERNSTRNNKENLDASENVYEKAWYGERWRTMADAIRKLNESMSRGFTLETVENNHFLLI